MVQQQVQEAQTWSLQGIAQLLGNKLGWPQDTAAALIDGVSQTIATALAEGREVVVEDFAKLRALKAPKSAKSSYMVPSGECVDPIAGKLGTDTATVEKAIREYFGILRERLTTNDKLKIDRFLALKVTEEKARIVDDPISGQKLISPAKKVISFMAHPKFRSAIGNLDISFIPSVSLKEGVESIKSSRILLAIPERDFFTETLEFHFNRAGWQVQVTTTKDEALHAIESGATYLVLIDASLPDYQALCESIKCSKKTSLIPVILMLPTGADPDKATEFRVLGNEQLAQPFEIKKLLTVAEAELQRSSEEEIIFQQEVAFQFPTTDESIDKANDMAATIFAESGLDEEGQVALCAAFREGVGNAAQHGNKHRRDKTIDVLYLLDQEKITVIIKDMGNGFDWRLYVDDGGNKGNAVDKARRRHQEGKLGGLGIMLMLKCADKLEYNESGNVITLYKYLPGKKPA